MPKLVLTKGSKLNLTKQGGGKLSKIRLGLSWSFREGLDADLDASIVFLGRDGKMWAEDSIVYFHILESADGAVRHTGDVRGEGAKDAGEGEEDLENILIELPKVSLNTNSMAAVITSYSDSEPIHFGRVRNATVRVYDESSGQDSKILCSYDLAEDMSGFTSVVVADIRREGSEWVFHALAEKIGKSKNGLEDVVAKFSR
ncbi:MAG TPA: TerD family protein [Thermoanaerobaculia bacterium]|jgi:tellurium resistance protein TerD|nr:TerD family protein [Thermoanaerobaculia bacterium]HQP87967.1 TerD family protein [Thermoanaerobaculia bacterium]